MNADFALFWARTWDDAVCLDRQLTLEVMEAMVNRGPVPSEIICLDAGLQGNDQLKVNAVQTVKSHNRLKDGDLMFQVV